MNLFFFFIFTFLEFSSGSNKVILLVLDGLTQSLINRVSTNNMDKLIQNGANFTLTPEFPAATLPTLHSMMTGQHTDMTGVLDTEVDQYGSKLTPDDAEFWLYDVNLTTIAELNNAILNVDRSTGCIRFPGCQFYENQNKIFTRDHLYKAQEPVKESAWMHRNKRSLGEEIYLDEAEFKRSLEEKVNGLNDAVTEESMNVTVEDGNESVDSHDTNNNTVPNTVDEFFFNKTSDKEWLAWMEQIDTVASWLKSEHPVNLVLFYLDQPANQIRAFGPDSSQADLAVYKVDQFLGALLQVLEQRELSDSVNLVITGLHGYTEVTAGDVVDISNLVSDQDYFAYGSSTVLNIQPVRLDEELDVFASLQKHDSSMFTLFNKHRIPDRFKYKTNERVTDILLLAQEGNTFASRFYPEVKLLNERSNRENSLDNKYGFAGYDNALPSMESVLILAGPDIRADGLESAGGNHVNAVDVFPLLAHLLDLDISPRNGSLSVFQNHLTNPTSKTVQVIKNYITDLVQKQEYIKPEILLGLVIATTVLLILCSCWCCCCRNRSTDFNKIHNYRYSQVKKNRREEVRVDGSEEDPGDKVGLLTSAIMEPDDDEMFDQHV